MPSRRILNDQVLAQTTSATPTVMAFPEWDPDSAAQFVLEVLAVSQGVVAAAWRLEGAAKRVGTGNLAFVGTAPSNLVGARKDTGASAWDIAFGGSAGVPRVTVTGAAGVTIEWIATLKGILSRPLDNPPQDPGLVADLDAAPTRSRLRGVMPPPEDIVNLDPLFGTWGTTGVPGPKTKIDRV